MTQQYSNYGMNPYNVYQNSQFVHPFTSSVVSGPMDVSVFNFTPNWANAGLMANYASLGMDMNASLMTPQWLQNLNSTMAQYQTQQAIAQYPLFQAGTTAGDATSTGADGSTTTPGATTPGATNPFTSQQAGLTQEQREVQIELNQYGISSTGDLEKDKKALEQAKDKETKNKADAADIAKQLYKAMKGWGTDEEAVYAALDRLNDDNVLLVMEEWDKNYKASMDNESLMEAIQSDFSGDEEKKAVDKLNSALTHKSRTQKQDSEASAYEAKVDYENDVSGWWRWAWTSDDTINESFTGLIEQLKQGEATAKQKRAQDAARGNK